MVALLLTGCPDYDIVWGGNWREGGRRSHSEGSADAILDPSDEVP